LGVVVELK
jgi:hypothetical protein